MRRHRVIAQDAISCRLEALQVTIELADEPLGPPRVPKRSEATPEAVASVYSCKIFLIPVLGTRDSSQAGSGPAGSSTVMRVPAPTSLSTSMLPPYASTTALAIASPSPNPPVVRAREGSPR